MASLDSVPQWAPSQAEELLRSDVFGLVLERAREIYTNAWKEARTVEAREDCHRYITLLSALEADLGSIATTGELARKRNEDLLGKKNPWRLAR